jgi:cytochrome c oxidase subunit 3
MSEVAENISIRPDVFEPYAPEVKIRTKKMMMWFIIFAIVMLFGGITSALIVLHGKLAWLEILPPSALWISNGLVALSSLTIFLSLRMVKKGAQKQALFLSVVTLLLGIGFVVTQTQGWSKLSDLGMGYTITENESGMKSYRWNTLAKLKGVYGQDYYISYRDEKLIFENGEYYSPQDTQRSKPLTNTIMTTFNGAGAMLSVLIYVHIIHLAFGLIYMVINTYRLYRNRINQNNSLSLYIGGMYWHFMGLLWLYLFAFMFFLY